MRYLVRTISALALAALVAVVPATAASAKKPRAAAWAKKHDLKGAWRSKDADRDGVKNVAEYKLGTDPRKADSDKDGLKDGDEVSSANDPLARDTDADGIKDGAEHAGVVTAFDGETITIRQFKGTKITATVDSSCDVTADDSAAGDDDGFVDSDEGDWSDDGGDDFTADASTDEGETDVDLGDDDTGGACDDFADLEEDSVLNQAQLETRDGVTYLVGVEIA